MYIQNGSQYNFFLLGIEKKWGGGGAGGERKKAKATVLNQGVLIWLHR